MVVVWIGALCRISAHRKENNEAEGKRVEARERHTSSKLSAFSASKSLGTWVVTDMVGGLSVFGLWWSCYCVVLLMSVMVVMVQEDGKDYWT